MTQKKTPRYEQIADYLRGLVADAEPGARLPSDAELCERFGVSRMTARQAVQVLSSDGLVERKRGAGTFVAARRVQRLLGSPLSFTESMRRRGMTASSELLERKAISPTDTERESLGLGPSETAYMVERLRLADGVPMAIERAVMPVTLVESLQMDIERGSLHMAFEDIGHYPTKALAEVTARRGTKRERDLLRLAGSGVLLVEDRIIWDQNDMPLEHTVTSYAADRYSFQAVLLRGEEDQA
ncbi:MAG: GntR family transcriptional regulator [Actinobacteria bacterium]|nr:MAG: GntR family transcriptional regulator [Actinomycetota bacterium]REK38255.1 MAG: GntR family transcriptional regulator [Actinomycetota bacterium]